MIDVRPLRAEERDRVRALLAEVYRPYSAEMVPELYELYLAALLKIEEGITLVAIDGGDVVGTARVYPPGTAPIPLPAGWAWVRSVGVAKAARRAGVGQALMSYCAANPGTATALSLHTMDFMPDAVRLYERLGYERAPEWDVQVGKAWGFPPEECFLALAYRLAL
jgi:GNAT superfamily N-acetyltransferase